MQWPCAVLYDAKECLSLCESGLRIAESQIAAPPKHLLFRGFPVAYCIDAHSLPEGFQKCHLICVGHPIVADNMRASSSAECAVYSHDCYALP